MCVMHGQYIQKRKYFLFRRMPGSLGESSDSHGYQAMTVRAHLPACIYECFLGALRVVDNCLRTQV